VQKQIKLFDLRSAPKNLLLVACGAGIYLGLLLRRASDLRPAWPLRGC